MADRKHIKWDETAGAAENARRQLPALMARYFMRGRQALAKKAKDAELHTFRLATKRLRYTLELFRACYGPGLRIRLAALRTLQQCLGELNDCATAARVFADFSTRNSVRMKELDRFLTQRRLERTAEFHRIWTKQFDAPGQERWWTGYLARPVVRKRSTAGPKNVPRLRS